MILGVSLFAVVCALPIALFSQSTALAPNISAWVVPIAIAGLALGVPHGAVDHLTLTARMPVRKYLAFGLLYVLIAAIGTALIIIAPVPGFVAVLAFTVWHFGTGDVEAASMLQGTPEERGFVRVLHVLAVGSAPVLLPLTSPAAVSTLALLQPQLAELFTPTVIAIVRSIVLAFVVVTLLILIDRRQIRSAIELLALTALGYFVTPLLAFAVYFGFWHALRHTARLAEHKHGRLTFNSLSRTFVAGLPALIGFIVIVSAVTALSSSGVAMETWLWFGLAVVWGLTIPHMVMVAAFDRRQRRASYQRKR